MADNSTPLTCVILDDYPSMPLACVILDDYPGVAISSADWYRLGDAVQIRRSATPHTGDALVTALAGCRDTGVMRMRTPITAAKAQGVVVCGTDSHPQPAMELTWVLILAVMRHLVPEANALRVQGPWQQSVGRDLHGARLGLPTGRDRSAGRADRPGSRLAGQCVAFESGCWPSRGRRRAPGGLQAGAVRQQNVLATPPRGDVTARNDRDAFSQAVERIAA